MRLAVLCAAVLLLQGCGAPRPHAGAPLVEPTEWVSRARLDADPMQPAVVLRSRPVPQPGMLGSVDLQLVSVIDRRTGEAEIAFVMGVPHAGDWILPEGATWLITGSGELPGKALAFERGQSDVKCPGGFCRKYESGSFVVPETILRKFSASGTNELLSLQMYGRSTKADAQVSAPLVKAFLDRADNERKAVLQEAARRRPATP